MNELGVEYAVFGDDEGRSQVHASEGLSSLAAHIGVSLEELLQMPVEERSRRIAHVNACRTADPAVALRHLERRYAPG